MCSESLWLVLVLVSNSNGVSKYCIEVNCATRQHAGQKNPTRSKHQLHIQTNGENHEPYRFQSCRWLFVLLTQPWHFDVLLQQLRNSEIDSSSCNQHGTYQQWKLHYDCANEQFQQHCVLAMIVSPAPKDIWHLTNLMLVAASWKRVPQNQLFIMTSARKNVPMCVHHRWSAETKSPTSFLSLDNKPYSGIALLWLTQDYGTFVVLIHKTDTYK